LVAADGAPDGKQEEYHSRVLIWDAATGRELQKLPGHVTQLGLFRKTRSAFSPDSRLLATGDGAGHLRLWEVSTGKEVYHFDGHRTTVTPRFSPDGRLLLGASEAAPCFVYRVFETGDAAGVVGDPDQLWRDLADDDAAKAFRAIRRLASAPGLAVELIRKNLRPAKAVDHARVDKLLRALDSSSFSDRNAATQELRAIINRIGPTIAKARANASAEARQRLDHIADAANAPLPERVRQDRAIYVLELIGAPAAELLATLAGGAPEDRLTMAAIAARERLRPSGVK
jgi:hypothetical protein